MGNKSPVFKQRGGGLLYQNEIKTTGTFTVKCNSQFLDGFLTYQDGENTTLMSATSVLTDMPFGTYRYEYYYDDDEAQGMENGTFEFTTDGQTINI